MNAVLAVCSMVRRDRRDAAAGTGYGATTEDGVNRVWRLFAVAAVLGVVLDQVTKIWIVSNLEYRTEHIDIIPGFFQLVHAQNPGAAFGFMGNLDEFTRVAIFMVITVIAVGVILDMVRKLPERATFLPLVLGTIFSGALGNAIDRIHKQTVTDFLRFYTDNPEWVTWLRSYGLPPEYPSFNVADISLVVGVILFVGHSFFEQDEPEESPAEANGAEA